MAGKEDLRTSLQVIIEDRLSATTYLGRSESYGTVLLQGVDGLQSGQEYRVDAQLLVNHSTSVPGYRAMPVLRIYAAQSETR